MSELSGTTFLITGANTGIGRATAVELAERGGRVVLACRSEEKTRPVIDDIVRTTGDADVEFLPLDLADLESVRAAAAAFDEPLHVLVNNAGVAGQRGQTKQGFELAFGINHLGHFLFTNLLLDRLLETKGRVINVSSDSHYSPKAIDWDGLQRPTKSVTGLPEYGVSKLCNVLHAQELARRVDGVTTASLHPGVIASDVWRRVPFPVRSIMKLFMKSTTDGARTSVHCATTPDLANGAFYTNEREKAPSKVATPDLAAELWRRSEAWVAA
jgi:NAD(P)-dependent dehydrogenase (short-subunit alcohol dehydrogenase family)